MSFSRYGLVGEPGSAGFWAAVEDRGSPVSAPGPGGWSTLFLWRGSAARLWFESWSEPVALTRWADSDCWYAEVAMPERLRVTYQFHDVEGSLAGPGTGTVGEHRDPFNPDGAGAGRSIAATPDAQPQPHWPPVGPDEVLPVPALRVRWTSALLGGRRTVRVHRPDGPGPHPVVLLLDGDDWIYLHPLSTAVGSAVAAGELPAMTLVFVPTPHTRESELAADPGFWSAVREELLPLLAEHGVAPEADRLVVAGQSFGGLSALRAALDHPDLVTRVVCQSGAFWWPGGGADDPFAGPRGGAAAELLAGADLHGLRIAFDVGAHEHGMLPHCEQVERLTEQAGATVRVSRSDAGHDRAGWRHALLRDLAWALR